MTIRRTNCLLGTVATLVVCSAAEISVAAETTNVIMPGVACRYYGTLGSDTYFNPSGHGANGLANTSGSSKYLACPVPKDWYSDTEWAHVVLTDDDETCQLWTRNFNTSVYWNTTGVSYMGSGYYKYDFSAGGSYFSTYGKSVSLYCSVGAGDVLLHYYHQPY